MVLTSFAVPATCIKLVFCGAEQAETQSGSQRKKKTLNINIVKADQNLVCFLSGSISTYIHFNFGFFQFNIHNCK